MNIMVNSGLHYELGLDLYKLGSGTASADQKKKTRFWRSISGLDQPGSAHMRDAIMPMAGKSGIEQLGSAKASGK